MKTALTGLNLTVKGGVNFFRRLYIDRGLGARLEMRYARRVVFFGKQIPRALPVAAEKPVAVPIVIINVGIEIQVSARHDQHGRQGPDVLQQVCRGGTLHYRGAHHEPGRKGRNERGFIIDRLSLGICAPGNKDQKKQKYRSDSHD